MNGRLFRRGRIWYTHVVDDANQRHQRSTRCTDKRAAALVDQRLQRQAADPDRAAKESATISEALGLLLDNRRELVGAGRRSQATVDCYEVKAGHWVRLLESDTEGNHRPFLLAGLGPRHVDGFVSSRRTEGAGDNTIHKELVVMRAALKLARRRGIWKGDPAEVMPIAFAPAYKPKERALTREELQLLLPQLVADQAARVCFLVATSANWGESERARREHVREDLAEVFLDGTKRATRRRTVPIISDEQRDLLRYAMKHARGAGGRLFAPWSNVRRDLHAACERAKIAPCSPNDLRRTCSKWLRAAGVPPHLIAPVMGHKDSRMVEKVYGRLSTAELGQLLVEHVHGKRTSSSSPAAEDIAGALRAAAEQLATEMPDDVAALLRAAAHLSKSTASPVQQTGLDAAGLAGLPGPKTRGNLGEFVPRDGIEPPTRGFSNRGETEVGERTPQPERRVAWLLPAPRSPRAASPVQHAPARKRGAR